MLPHGAGKVLDKKQLGDQSTTRNPPIVATEPPSK